MQIDSGDDPISQLKRAVIDTKMPAKIVSDYKDIHAPLSKFGKVIDKSFNKNIEKTKKDVNFDKDTLHSIIAKHLYRTGRFALSDAFCVEAKIESDSMADMKQPLIEMYSILLSLSNRDIGPALEWAKSKEEDLKARGSKLELHLHKMQFIEHLANKRETEALAYARSHFPKFTENMNELQPLMGALIYSRRATTPYSIYLPSNLPSLWGKLSKEFTKDSCSLLEIPFDSPLHISITAGYKAIPTLIKLAALQIVKVAGEETATVEVELGQEYQFHSIFSCPVSREQSTKDSPPMLLVCNHVISKTVMTKSVKGSSTKFKCPYCPTEMTPSQAKQLYF
eukprot:TRINITY_DN2749_c0_g1_i1.p1 TRINITY_DN2749_c0_g1~~TRINITY_DN2749_c0_g1_i1.p1  ORF type:complete len:338 (+),score=65.68 TRINITY_DN2749_c0_g1_i1:194-1207(+)